MLSPRPSAPLLEQRRAASCTFLTVSCCDPGGLGSPEALGSLVPCLVPSPSSLPGTRRAPCAHLLRASVEARSSPPPPRCRLCPAPRVSSAPPPRPSTTTTAFLSCCRSWTLGFLRPSRAPKSSAAAPRSASSRPAAAASGSRGCPPWTRPSPPEGPCRCRLSGNLPQAVSSDCREEGRAWGGFVGWCPLPPVDDCENHVSSPLP